MRQIGSKLILMLATVGLLASEANDARASTDFVTVSVLDRAEPFEGSTFHAGILWVGKSREQFSSNYSMQMYRDGQLLGRVTLPHSAAFAYPYGPNSILVVGIGFSPNLSHYSIIEHRNGRFSIQTQRIPVDALARQWLGTFGGREYFTDPGGNPNDRERENNFNLAAQTFFTMQTQNPQWRRPSFLSARLRLPTYGIKLNDQFYVLNRESIGQPHSNVHRLNPRTNQIVPLLPTYRNYLASISVIKSSNFITLTEQGAGLFLIVDATTGRMVSETYVSESPKSHAIMGRCAVIGDDMNRLLTILDLTDVNKPELLMNIEIDLPESELRRVSHVMVDENRLEVYLRSNFPCHPMLEACNEDWNRVVKIAGYTAQKIADGCQI